MAIVAEIVGNHRRPHSGLLAAFFLAVQQAEWILVKTRAAVFAERVSLRIEEIDELLAIGRTAVRIADGVQMEVQVFQSQLVENFTSHGDDFCICQRRRGSQHFQAELMEFSVAAGLRTVVAEHGADVKHLMYLLIAIHFMFQVSAHGRSCILRTKRHRAVASILEGIHFLRHHIGGIADAALK